VDTFEPHLSLVTALGVGLLVGLEREQVHPGSQATSFGGVRTFPILALVGAIATLLAPVSGWIPLVALVGVIVLVAISYAANVRKDGDHGATTEASVLATYLLGSLAAGRGVIEPVETRLLLTIGLGVILTFLLSSKQWLHGVATRVSRDDFYATVKFLIVAVIVLPLLPREDLGPLDAINPFTIGLMVVMISGLSFVGYVAMRLLGPERGLLVGAGAGGLVSSTAVTLAFAGRAKNDAALVPAAAGAIAIASAIMIGRVAVLVAIVHPRLLSLLAIPLVGAAAGSIAGGLVTYRRPADQANHDIGVKNPFELGTAIRFGIVFALVLLVVQAANTYLGNQGLYLAALVAGSTDVDAISLSTAKLANGAVDAAPATIAIMIAIGSNTLAKSGLALGLGGRPLGMRAFVIGGLTVLGGAIATVATLAVA
jgi:uncharacterized membrane protein (DUF4010 family)